ncbi:hypothetical protein MBLNU459_g7445t1 [Dothideomycetes sp. NU459]
MEVDKISFPSRLLDILVAISEAHFIAFDLELSGVPVKARGDHFGKPSLQERYLETKRAAENYQILQIGLTCVKEEDDRGVYSLKPFNFNLNPIVEERLDIDRNFTFHSGAVEFLLGVGFRMDLPFTSGVPYLSRSEATLAEERAAARQDRGSFADIQVKIEDTQSLKLISAARHAITQWIETQKPNPHSLVIGPSIVHGESQTSHDELSRFERRLIHQLVRAEHPELVTIPYRGLIRIARFDQEREDYIKAQRSKESRERITRQTGFRWIVEAMSGNSVDDIDVKSFARDLQTAEPIFVHLENLKSKFYRAKHLLRNKKTPLVGHNLFLDLIYLYRTFIGELPDTVEEFSELIHALFPTIVDTKYMATHNCGDINPASSLEQIADQLKVQQYPTLEIDAEFAKYDGTTAFHEAGYDSMLTAQVAIRLSAKLEHASSSVVGGSFAESKATLEVGSEPSTPPDDGGGVTLSGTAAVPESDHNGNTLIGTPVISSVVQGLHSLFVTPVKALVGETASAPEQSNGSKVDEHNESGSATNMEGATDTGNAFAVRTIGKKSKKKRKKGAKDSAQHLPAAHAGRFAHATVFDQLHHAPEQCDIESEQEVLQFDTLPSSTQYTSAPVVADSDGMSGAAISAPIDWDTPHWRRMPGKAMPRFDTDFWKVYGNRLRVFGTEEGLCQLR